MDGKRPPVQRLSLGEPSGLPEAFGVAVEFLRLPQHLLGGGLYAFRSHDHSSVLARPPSIAGCSHRQSPMSTNGAQW